MSILPLQIYERLKANTEAFPIAGNKAGSYLTGFSRGGLEVNIIFLISGFGQMFVDQSYWQSAVAASPTNAVKVRWSAAFGSAADPPFLASVA